MIVLSLFDGMGCGLAALKKAGIPVTKYYASEIDKHAMAVAKARHPEIIHIGDVTHWPFWEIERPDLLIGGSPCQGFSFVGKKLLFDDPRSKLFFVYDLIRKHYDVPYFFLENVRMPQRAQDVITEYLGVEPVMINSNLVSAQNRRRLYWKNWYVPQPKDRGIVLKDILLPADQVDDKYYCNENQLSRFERSDDLKKKFSVIDPVKAACITARQYGNRKGTFVTGARITGRRVDPVTGMRVDDRKDIKTNQRVELRADGKANCMTTTQKDSMVGFVDMRQRPRGYNKGFEKAVSKTPTLSANAWQQNNHVKEGVWYRRLTPVECERLQTLPDGYTGGVSDAQRYKMLGNGWTLDAIVHQFKHAPFHPAQGVLS